MIIYTFFLIFVCTVIYAFRYLQNNKTVLCSNAGYKYRVWKRLSFATVFLILAVFSAIRDGIGIDYVSYMMHIHNIQLGRPNYMEEGFKFLARALGHINPNPRLVIIVFAILTCFFYVKAIYDQSKDVLMSIFIFLSWGYYFFTFNTIRNYFALSVCLYSIKFLKEKKYVPFLVLVLLAATIHKSALICIPVYLLANYKYSFNQLRLMLLAPFAALMLKGPVRAIVFKIYPRYLGSAYDVGRISYLNVMKAMIVVALGFMFFRRFKNDRLCRIYFHLNIFSLIYYVGLYWMPEVSRIGFYMNATSIMFIPNLIASIESKENKEIVKKCVYLSGFMLFVLLMIGFYSPTTKLLPYQTWIF